MRLPAFMLAGMLWIGLLLLPQGLAADAWHPAKVPLMTRWGKMLSPENVHQEYPRPQMVRSEWLNLNGLWDYAVTQKTDPRPKKYQGKILVPFPIESALSGVHKSLEASNRLWYRRTFDLPKEWAGQRVLLHFDAVDWETTVRVNGKPLGSHRGGYDRFSFDISDALVANGPQEIDLDVLDATSGEQVKGKQSGGSLAGLGTVAYCASSGIWQTVWLEPVPAASIADLKITPEVNLDPPVRSVVRIMAACRGTTDGDSIEAVAIDGSREIARSTGKPGDDFTLSIPQPKLWSPDRPILYDLKVTLHHAGQADDVVKSYFGMRKIALGKDEKGVVRILLNGQFVFQIGPLDQGFWPDGIYTAPSDEALRYDIEMTKKLGFNTTRKHIKVEPDRWYYWCDRLGLLVWQDMPSGGGQTSPAAARQFELEMRRMIENHANHPSIVMWIIFNEEWGQYDPVRLTDIVRGLDPTRLVNTVSCGNTHGAGDIIDDHPYWIPRAPKGDGKRAVVIGEFGGRAMALPGHVVSVEKAFGHPGGTVLASPWELTTHYLKLLREVQEEREKSGLNGAICTQLTDIEEECNGFMTYDRDVVKVDLEQVAAADRGHLPPVKQFRNVSPTAQEGPVIWRYSLANPGIDWAQPNFDDSEWSKGPGGFGLGNWRTQWTSPDIWLRREFTLDSRPLNSPELLAHHDRDVEVYLNGVLASKISGYSIEYQEFEIRPEAKATLKPGKNVIAVHCIRRDKTAGYIDVGVVDAPASAAPQIFWASDPVRPNETVLIQGSDFGNAPTVEIARLADDKPTAPDAAIDVKHWISVPLLQATDCSLKFVVPAEWKNGVFAVRVMAGGATSQPTLVNAPDPWWIQGDQGDSALPGGWLRVCGKSLAFGGETIARLEAAGHDPIVLKAKTADCYTLRFDLPKDLAPASYSVFVHNGFGGNAAWRKAGVLLVKASTGWPTKQFNVLDFYGKDAAQEMQKSLNKYYPVPDRTAGIKAALKQAQQNGGGIVYFPPGRYGITEEISVPPRTLLKGAGMGTVVLWWGKGQFNLDGGGEQGLARDKDKTKRPINPLSGSEFGLEDLSVYLPFDHQTGISCGEHFLMRRVRVRVDHFWTIDGSKRPEGTMARIGNNFTVTDCDLLAKGEGLCPGQNGIIARNRVLAGKINCTLGGSQQVIVEDNHFVSLYPTAYENIAGTGRNIYFGHNTLEALYAQQSDYSFTFDAGDAAYWGKIAAANGTQITLAQSPTYPDWAKENSSLWRRAIVLIQEGRGAGQYRNVVSNTDRQWEIDRPFDCPPDDTSLVTIVPMNGRVLVVGNRFEDASWVNAAYGTAIDVVYAENQLYRCGQLLNYGCAPDKAFQPSWYVQFLDNELHEGLTSAETNGFLPKPERFGAPNCAHHSLHRSPSPGCSRRQ